MFRKKPVVIEAIQFNGYSPEWWREADTIPWINAAYEEDVLSNVGPSNQDCRLTIKTLEGKMTVSPGDWIIRGVQGEIYPCKPDIFSATYEPE